MPDQDGTRPKMTPEQARLILSRILAVNAHKRPPERKRALDPLLPTRSVAQSSDSLDKLVGLGGDVGAGVLGLANDYAKDAFRSSEQLRTTGRYDDPSGVLWPAFGETTLLAKGLPKALMKLSKPEKSAAAGARAGVWTEWLKKHLQGDTTQEAADEKALQLGKAISEQSQYVQDRLKKIMGDKAFEWAKKSGKPVFSDPDAMGDPKTAPTVRALFQAGIAGFKYPDKKSDDKKPSPGFQNELDELGKAKQDLKTLQDTTGRLKGFNKDNAPKPKGGRGPGMIGSMLGIFAGPYAAANLAKEGMPEPQQALEMAKKMEAEGATPEQIYAKTSDFLKETPFAGITKTRDGQFRFEIPDNEMTVKKNAGSGRMDQIIYHPLFFMAYPKMKDRTVSIREKKTGVANAAGGYNPGDGSIAIDNPEYNADSDIQVLAHEMNHAAQHFEENMFEGTIAPASPTVENAKKYLQQPSEAEAEESAYRRSWSPEKRKAIPPGYSFPGGADKERPPWLVKSADQLIKPGPNGWWMPWMGEKPNKVAKPKVSENPPESIVELMGKLRDAYRKERDRETKPVPGHD